LRLRSIAAAGPVEVHVESGDVKVVVAPPAPAGLDRRLYNLINGLPHTTTSDRYVSVLSDLGEGIGWVAGGVALGILGGSKGRRAGLAVAFSSLTGRALSVELAEDVLKDVFPQGEQTQISIERIQELVCERFAVTMAELTGDRRSQNIVYPRQVAMYLSRELTDASLPKIGKEFGGRDHTTGNNRTLFGVCRRVGVGARAVHA